MSTSKDKFKSKTPRSDKASGVSVSDILAFAAGKKPGDALTAADIDVAVKKAGITGKDAKAIRNATDKFLSSGSQYMLQGDGNYNVYGEEGQITTQKRSTGNKVGFGAGDLIGLGNNMSKLVGLAKMYKGAFDESKKAASSPASTGGEQAPAGDAKKSTGTPKGGAGENLNRKLTSREIMEAQGRAQGMLDSIQTPEQIAQRNRSQDLIMHQPQVDMGIGDWRTAGKNPGKPGKKSRTTPGLPVDSNLLIGDLIRAFDPKTWERLGIAFNPAQIWDEDARQKARMMAQEDMQDKQPEINEYKRTQKEGTILQKLFTPNPEVSQGVIPHMGFLTPGPKQVGPLPFKGVGDKMKGAFDKLAGKMAPKVKMPKVQKVVPDQLPAAKTPLQIPQNASKASDKLLGQGAKRVQGFGVLAKPKIKIKADGTRFKKGGVLPKGADGMKFRKPASSLSQQIETGDLGKKYIKPVDLMSGMNVQPSIDESGAFASKNLTTGSGAGEGGDALAAFGKVAKYALPFIGTQLANKELGKVKPMNFKKANLQSGVVSDIPRPNFGLRYRVPTGNDVQSEISGQKFADAQQRDAEANFNVANATSRIAQRQQIVNNQNRNEMFNTQGENHARMFNANQLLNTQAMRSQNVQEPFIAAQHHLATDISTDAFLKSSRDMDAAEMVLKTAKPGSPEYQAALKKMGFKKGGKIKTGN